MARTISIVVILAVGLLALQGIVLSVFGQPSICGCGYIKLWEGTVLSSGNSQHLMDWYTFSHVIHGFLFYLALWLLFPRQTLWNRLLLAIGIEVAWELLENTPMVIEHYRQQALAQGYIGDSILNSLMDTIAMILGFLLAWRLPVAIVVFLAIAMEVFVGIMIHDNLALNILGFFYQFEFISEWQSGG